MKKLAIVTPGLLPVPAIYGGAVETLITYLIEGNEKNPCYEITIFTCSVSGLERFQYKYAKIIQIRTDNVLGFLCRGVNWAGRRMRLKESFNPYLISLRFQKWSVYDEILVENSMRAYEVLEQIKECKGKLSYHMHNDIEDEKGDKSPERAKLVINTSKRILAVSNFIKVRLENIQYTNRIKILYNCVDLNLFQSNPEKSDMVRKKYGISADNIVIMYSGRIAEEKGTLEMIKGVKNICREYKDVKILIVGCCWFPNIMDGEYLEEIKKESDSFSEQIIFTGYIPMEDMPPVYETADILIIPTKVEEAFGMVALEAMALRTAVVSVDSGGLSEVLDDSVAMMIHKNGVMEEHIENCVRQLMKDKELRGRLAANGYDYVVSSKEFNKEFYFEKFTAIMSE